ncbi:MAG: hypothetical protein LBS57_07045 [Treponema sp.]|jgi:hypothetical protein|nr:hypothetical protein [Treponema sp.]
MSIFNHLLRRPLKSAAALVILLLAGPVSFAEADTDKAALGDAAKPGLLPDFKASVLWTGSWDFFGNLVNRGDFRLGAFGLVGRTQVLDKRPSFLGEGWETGDTAFSGGLYHNQTGSRLLYGALEEWGLPARLRNPWGKSTPFVSAHKPMAADLRTEPSSTAKPEAYLYLGSPWLGLFSKSAFFRPYGIVQFDDVFNHLFGAGLDTRLPAKTGLRVEGFYAGRHLAARQASAWFSEAPPLPERDTRLYGLGLFFTGPFVSAAADGAFSETFAWGRGLYGNLALRLGNRPWELNLGVTGADSRFTDRAGTAVGAAFRMAGRFEWKWKRTSFIRGGVDIRAPQYGEDFDRGAVSFYYRFPSNLKTGGFFPFRPVRVSAEISRDARDRGRVLDKAETGAGFNLGPFGLGLQGSVSGVSAAGTEAPFPFPAPASREFDAAKISGNVSYSFSVLSFGARAGYTMVNEKPPVWDFSLSAAIRGRLGRFRFRIGASEFPREWTCSLSWRLQLETKRGK